MAKTETFTGYCMKCRKSVEVEGKYTETGNNRAMLKGTHKKCSTTVCKVTRKR